jgi:cyclic-di-AMP phosphodiesterase PgpH
MGEIRYRRPAGPAAGVVLSLVFAALLLPVATFELWAPGAEVPPPGKTPRYTLRVPDIGVFQGSMLGKPRYFRNRVVAPAGKLIAEEDRQILEAYYGSPGRLTPLGGTGLAVCFALGALLFCSFQRNFVRRGSLLRTQLTALGAIWVLAVGAKALLLFTALSPFILPVCVLAIVTAMHLDRQMALATGALASFTAAALVPFDFPLGVVLLMQCMGVALFVRPGRISRAWLPLGAGLAAALVGIITYLSLHYLLIGRLPEDDLESALTSGVVATAIGPLVAGVLAWLVSPILERLLGYVSRARLQELADLEQPTLKRLAAEAPGTWQHSLAVANLCEIAANVVGANGLLCRVGALYHDLGKIYDPRYFVENLKAGEKSPHEGLAPEASASAIAAHCEEGVKLARKAHLPAPVIDFIHMHHGDAVIEYFWEKYKRQPNGGTRRLAEKDFRYPGLPPQNRETGILALCDAVEAASRTLKGTEERAVENLVEHILFSKLRSGQLDHTGLTPEELHKVSNALVEALGSSLHARVEYPWQRGDAAEGAPGASVSSSEMPAVPIPAPIADTPTSRSGKISLLALAAAAEGGPDAVPSLPLPIVPAPAAAGAGRPEESSPATVTAAAAEGEVEYEYSTDVGATITTTAKIEAPRAESAPVPVRDTPSGRVATPTSLVNAVEEPAPAVKPRG